MTLFCQRCGAKVTDPEVQKFCGKCGEGLQEKSGVITPTNEPTGPPPGQWFPTLISEQRIGGGNRQIGWPNACACCLGPAEMLVGLKRSSKRSVGLGYTVTTVYFWRVPHCKRCAAHSWSLSSNQLYGFLLSGLLLIGVPAAFAQPGPSSTGLGLFTLGVFICVFGATIGTVIFRKNKAKKGHHDTCATREKPVVYTGQRLLKRRELIESRPQGLFEAPKDPENVDVFGHGFLFANHTYARYFIHANTGNRAEVFSASM